MIVNDQNDSIIEFRPFLKYVRIIKRRQKTLTNLKNFISGLFCHVFALFRQLQKKLTKSISLFKFRVTSRVSVSRIQKALALLQSTGWGRFSNSFLDKNKTKTENQLPKVISRRYYFYKVMESNIYHLDIRNQKTLFRQYKYWIKSMLK